MSGQNIHLVDYAEEDLTKLSDRKGFSNLGFTDEVSFERIQ